MEVRKIPGIWGAYGPSHGPYWLWPVREDGRPGTREPVGEVKIDFDYLGYLAQPHPVALVVQDDEAKAFLESFAGGDLLVTSPSYERAFLFKRVSKPRKKSAKTYEIIVPDYEHKRPIPDAFDWSPPPPKPEPPKPTEAERQKAVIESMLDMNSASIRRAVGSTSPGGRRVKKSRSTKPEANR